MSVFCDAKSFIFRFLCLLLSVENTIIFFRICSIKVAEIKENYFQKLHTNICRNTYWSLVKRAFNWIFLITCFKLLKLLSVVCEFGWQTNDCKNYIQNICSVVYLHGRHPDRPKSTLDLFLPFLSSLQWSWNPHLFVKCDAHCTVFLLEGKPFYQHTIQNWC